MKKIIDWVKNFFETLDWGEIWRYFIVGVGSTFLDFAVTFFLKDKLNVPVMVGNVAAWIISTTYAFFTNTYFVFKVKPKNLKELFIFMGKFYGERIFTLGVEELIFLVFDNGLKWPYKLVKVGAQCAVIALNFLISKFIIYRHNNKE